jgi:hypothetical protein
MFTTTFCALGVSLTVLLVLFKVLVQSGVKLPYLWLEVKLLQTWLNTACISIFALFAYPYSMILIMVQIIFVYVRPFHNPDSQSKY